MGKTLFETPIKCSLSIIATKSPAGCEPQGAKPRIKGSVLVGGCLVLGKVMAIYQGPYNFFCRGLPHLLRCRNARHLPVFPECRLSLSTIRAPI